MNPVQTVARPTHIAHTTHCIPYLKPKLDNGMAAVQDEARG